MGLLRDDDDQLDYQVRVARTLERREPLRVQISSLRDEAVKKQQDYKQLPTSENLKAQGAVEMADKVLAILGYKQ